MKKEKIFIAMLLCCSFLLMSCSGQEEKILIEQPERESQPVLPEEASENGISEETHSRKTIWVDVCGAVKHPGVYELEEGSRVFEAVRAAGGFLEDADSKWLNQAAPAEDGTKIMIYTREEAEKMEEQGAVFKETGSEEGKDASGKINLNTASLEQLQEIPGIGLVRAGAILDYREKTGKFQSIEEIQNVPGIKGKIFEKMETYITVK